MSDFSVNVLVDAKEEYMKQIVQILRPQLMSGLLSIYDEAMEICTSNNEEDLTLLTFQELLSQVPKWSQVLVDQEAENIVKESNCDYIEDLLTATFVCHTKILTSVRVAQDNKKRQINLKIPSVERFIHHVYIEIAREFWKHPYLVKKDDVSKLQYQKNLREVENIIATCIENTVRHLLPVKNILKEYLADDEEDEDDDEDNNSTNSSSSSMQAGGGVSTSKTDKNDAGGPGGKKKQKNSSSAEDSNKKTLSSSAEDSNKKTLSSSAEDSDTKNLTSNADDDKVSSKEKGGDSAAEDKSTDGHKTDQLAVSSTKEKTPAVTNNSMRDYDELNRILQDEQAGKDRAQIKEVSIDTDKKLIGVASSSSVKAQTGDNYGSKNDSSKSSDSDITSLLSKSDATGITDLLGGGSGDNKSDTAGITDLLRAGTAKSNSDGTTGITDLLGGGDSSAAGNKVTTSASSEIALDTLGNIEQVNVDFGMPSQSSGSATPSTNVKNEVLNEFDRIANSTTTTTPASDKGSTSDGDSSKPAAAYSFF